MANTYTDHLKLRMPEMGDTGWDDEVNDNTMIHEFVLSAILKSNVVISGLVPSDGGGLDVDVTAGDVVVAGASYSVGAGSKTCTSGVTNWLYVDDSGVLQIADQQPVGDYVALALIDASTSTLDRIADARNFAEGALTINVNYAPNNYSEDTSETGAINQHLAGIDDQLGLMAGLKNKIINGNFERWERGISQTSSGYGSCDRWVNINTGTTKTTSRQTFSLGQNDVPHNPQFYSRTVVSSVAGSSNLCCKIQRIEGVKTFSGNTVTFSFYAKADASRNIATEFVQDFGTGGSPSSRVLSIGVTTHALTTSWQKFSTTFNIPIISGKTLGTSNDSLQLYIWFDAGSDHNARTNSLGQQSGTFDMSQIQLEQSETATTFETLPIGLVSLLCWRYYWQGPFEGHSLGSHNGFAYQGYAYSGSVSFPVIMRIAPTPSIVTTPSYTNCVHHSLSASQTGMVHRVDTTAAGLYRVTFGSYAATAEI